MIYVTKSDILKAHNLELMGFAPIGIVKPAWYRFKKPEHINPLVQKGIVKRCLILVYLRNNSIISERFIFEVLPMCDEEPLYVDRL